MRAMVGVNARIAHRRRRHRTRASFRLGPWVVLAVLVSLVVPGAFAAPFADRTALKAAVDSCITLDPTGVACCNHGADCGAAGTVEMPDWDVSLVTDMSSLFSNKGSFTADISRWDVSSVTTMAHMFSFANRFNADISQWDVSSVTTMNMMFRSNWWFNAGDKGVVVLPNFSRFYLFSEGPHRARLPCFWSQSLVRGVLPRSP